MIDSNGDGSISVQERDEFVNTVVGVWNALDTDGQGDLSADEI